jgi:hypothetical protein
VSEFLDILGLVKSYFSRFFWRKKIKKIEIFFCGAPDAPEDEAICLFAGLLANPDMPLSRDRREREKNLSPNLLY